MSLEQIATALGSLALVLAVVVAVRPLAARLLQRGVLAQGRASRLGFVQGLALDPRRRLLLLRCDGREFLVLSGPRDVFLGWLDRG